LTSGIWLDLGLSGNKVSGGVKEGTYLYDLGMFFSHAPFSFSVIIFRPFHPSSNSEVTFLLTNGPVNK